MVKESAARAAGPAVCRPAVATHQVAQTMSHSPQPVFAVACLSDPFPTGKLAVTGGVFGFGEVSELFLWNSQLQARRRCCIALPKPCVSRIAL